MSSHSGGRKKLMANEEHVRILKQGVKTWNEWRKDNPQIIGDLSGLDLREADLFNVNLSFADLSKAALDGAVLSHANLSQANLREAGLIRAILIKANVREADLSRARLGSVRLLEANLTGANLSEADLRLARLTDANLSRANLRGADLSEASLIGTDFTKANLTRCHIFGISAWKVNLEGAIQSDLIISDARVGEPVITVDNLEVAQFIYLLLNNQKIREVIDTITTKAVLILGRFSDERKAVLDAIRNELRQKDYVPIMFDFEKPQSRNFTETVRTLASLSRFVIVDLSDPNSAPHEIMSFAEQFRSVPLQAIFCPTKDHQNPYPMYNDLSDFNHVLPIYRYDNQQQLLDNLSEKVIDPAEAKVQAMKPKSSGQP
jgi:uncharacterized protein YjbI with pentapeptide repeats